MLKKGLIQVFTSQSDKTNFAPIGLSLRAAGQGLRTLIMAFQPHDLMEGGKRASSYLEPYLQINNSAVAAVSNGKGRTPNFNRIIENFKHAEEAVLGGKFDIVILHGINHILDQGLIPIEEIMGLFEQKPENVELVLSGPRAHDRIIEMADLVTEMVVHKSAGVSKTGNCPKGKGAIEVVTGNGKGKTTYCLGKGMLTSCLGIPALILQFIKSPRLYGEVKAIKKLPYLEIKTMGKGFLGKHSPYLQLDKKHKIAAQQAWHLLIKQIYSQDYGLLVLDEINIATYHGLISGPRVKELLFLEPQKFDILLSGRHAHPEVIDVATTVIEMKEIKHPYKKGIKARKGIEF